MKLIKKKILLNFFSYSIFINKNIYIIYIYANKYFTVINISKNSRLKIKNINEFYYNEANITSKISFKEISMYFNQFLFCEFSKIRFSGKGYKIKKNSTNSIILLFNRSHTTTLCWNNIIIKKLKKYKIYIRTTKINLNIINLILRIRFINIFTKKGLRKSRQILLKKKGKK